MGAGPFCAEITSAAVRYQLSLTADSGRLMARLTRVELYDHAFVEGLVAILAGGQGQHAASHRSVIPRQPLWGLAPVAQRLLHDLEVLGLATALRPADRVADLHVRRADIGLAEIGRAPCRARVQIS